MLIKCIFLLVFLLAESARADENIPLCKTAFLNTSILGLSLSARTKNVLQKSGIHKVADLLKYTSEDLKDINNFGHISLKEVENQLQTHGFTLRENIIPIALSPSQMQYLKRQFKKKANHLIYMPIKNAGFSPDIIRMFKKDHINYLGELLVKTPNDLLRIRLFGKTTLKKVEHVLQQKGLYLLQAPLHPLSLSKRQISDLKRKFGNKLDGLIDLPIENTGFPRNAVQALQTRNIYYLGELLVTGKKSLLQIESLTYHAYDKVLDILKEKGLYLNEDS